MMLTENVETFLQKNAMKIVEEKDGCFTLCMPNAQYEHLTEEEIKYIIEMYISGHYCKYFSFEGSSEPSRCVSGY